MIVGKRAEQVTVTCDAGRVYIERRQENLEEGETSDR